MRVALADRRPPPQPSPTREDRVRRMPQDSPIAATFLPLPSAFCLLPSAFCQLPSAFCLLPSAFCQLPSAYCSLFARSMTQT
jgi:hypothetical protein